MTNHVSKFCESKYWELVWKNSKKSFIQYYYSHFPRCHFGGRDTIPTLDLHRSMWATQDGSKLHNLHPVYSKISLLRTFMNALILFKHTKTTQAMITDKNGPATKWRRSPNCSLLSNNECSRWISRPK